MIIKKGVFSVVGCVLCLVLCLPIAFAEEEQDSTFDYDSAGRREPFKVLLDDGTPPPPPGPVNCREGEFPLVQYKPETFRLMGTILGMGDYAMILAPDGKTYTISVGTPIGTCEGKVLSISENMVLVKEIHRFEDGTEQELETSIYLNPLEKETQPAMNLFWVSSL